MNNRDAAAIIVQLFDMMIILGEREINRRPTSTRATIARKTPVELLANEFSNLAERVDRLVNVLIGDAEKDLSSGVRL